MKRFLIFVTFFILALIISCPVSAKESSGIEVYPAYVEVEMQKPEEEKEIVFTYINHTNSQLILSMQAIDFHQVDTRGTVGFLNANSGN